jgi:hypothetical protein
MGSKHIALLAVMTALASAETVTLEADMDTYTLPTGGCFGASGELWHANKPAVGHPDERVMVHFDLSGYTESDLESATLHMKVFFQCPSGQGTFSHVLAVTEPWDESWSGTHAACGTTVYQSYHFLGMGWHELDVTALVEDWLDGSLANQGLVLKVIGIYPWTKFRSRETAFAPYLTIEIDEQALESTTWGGIKAGLQDLE